MPEPHGASTIKEWIEDLVDLARSGGEFVTSAGANPGRDYAYLEYHMPDGEHSILLFNVEDVEGQPRVRAYRFDGQAEEIREYVNHLTHGS